MDDDTGVSQSVVWGVCGGDGAGAAIMAALDLLTREVQALRRRVNNSIQIPVAESLDGTNTILPAAPDRINQAVVTNSSGAITVAPLESIAVPAASFVTATDEHVDLPTSRRIAAGDGTTVTDNGPGGTLEINAPAINTILTDLSLGTFVTVAPEGATFGQSRQLTAGANITITDGGAAGPITIAAATQLKTPYFLDLLNAYTVRPFVYDALNDRIFGGDTADHHVIYFSPGSQGAITVLTASGFDKVTAMVVTPAGLVFCGRNDNKLSIFDGATLALSVDASAITDMDGCMIYSAAEDLVWSVGGVNSGNKVFWSDPTTGAHVGSVTNNGDTTEDPPLKQNALAVNAAGDVFYVGANAAAKLSKIAHTTHVHSVLASTGLSYASAGALIVDANDNLWIFAANSTLTIYLMDQTTGAVLLSFPTGIDSGDCYLTLDPVLNRIHFVIGACVGVWDATAQVVLGRTTKNMVAGTSLAWDSVRQKLWQGLSGTGYAVFQM